MVINSKWSLLFPPALFPIRNCAQDSAFCQWFANFGSLALFPFLPWWSQMGDGGAESRLGSVSPSHRPGFRVIVSLSPSFLATPRHLWQTVYYGKGISTQRFNYNGWLRILDSLFRTRRISRLGSCSPQLYLQGSLDGLPWFCLPSQLAFTWTRLYGRYFRLLFSDQFTGLSGFL